MKRIIVVFTAALCLVFGFAGVGYGKSTYATSFKSTYPSSPLSSLSTVSGQAGNLCTVCHGTSGTPLNAFGSAYSANGHSFSAIQNLDSDGDSFSNLDEINAGTFPGNAASKPAPTGDTAAPVVTAFSVPGTSSSLTVSITTLTATDAVGVTGYLVNESSTKPSATAAGWSVSKPASYTFGSAGSKTLYAWAKDAAGNVSNSLNAGVMLTISAPAPTVSLMGVFKKGRWFMDLDGNDAWEEGADARYSFGKPGDKPVVGDWDGSGVTKIGVFRDGKWLLDLNGNGIWDESVDARYSFGIPGFKPVVGDWDGSGVTKIGVFNGGRWALDLDGNGTWEYGIDVVYAFGRLGDKPVVGDWDGSGVTKIGVFRDGKWLLDLNGNGVWEKGVDAKYSFGSPGDRPVVGDWDGSGVVRIGVVRAGVWYMDINGDGVWDPAVDISTTFGMKGTPVTGTW